jgi:type I restriction enzyme S subunit
MIQQKTYGSVVQHIEPHHIADLPVPLPDATVQERIHALVDGAAAARTEAARLLDEAGAYFDALAGPMPSAHDHARAAAIVARARLDGRLDAFYHVGWAAEPQLPGGERIGHLAEVISTSRVPRIYVERGAPFLSGIDVFRICPPIRVRLATRIAESFDARVRAGDLAVQGSGQRYGLVGRVAYIGRRLDGWASSHDLFRIRASDPTITARIFAFLRSESGHRVMLRHSYGTSIPHVNPQGIADVEVPLLPPELNVKANRALELREQADADEERAIQEVESWLA